MSVVSSLHSLHLHDFFFIISPSSTDSARREPQQNLAAARLKWLRDFPSRAPSESAQPSQFAADQKKIAFNFNRPPDAAATIPVTLYHPVFGQFQEDCQAYMPTKDDHEFVRNFAFSMSQLYDKEDERASRARDEIESYGLAFRAAKIKAYTTDGDLRFNGLSYAILKVKNELGVGGADPLIQAAWYYTAFVREKIRDHPGSCFPCLLIYIAGAFPIIFISTMYI